MELPKLAIAALGGTVSMQSTQNGQGVVPAVSGEALLNTVPELNMLARATVETFGLLPSASLDFEYLLDVLNWANAQISQGVAAVIIIQGTDTLEESATFFDYLWAHDEPLVLTGAMRSAMQAGADGPANLLDAGRVALAACSHGRGAQVVINGEIHRASSVRKVDSMAMHAFASPLTGPAGLIVEGAPRYFHAPVARHVFADAPRHPPEYCFAGSFARCRQSAAREGCGARLRRPGDRWLRCRPCFSGLGQRHRRHCPTYSGDHRHPHRLWRDGASDLWLRRQ